MLPSSVLLVCQTFAVLEDGALAHNLQEQESKYGDDVLFKTSAKRREEKTIDCNKKINKTADAAGRLEFL